MEKLDEARWLVHCGPYLNAYDRAKKINAMVYASVLARNYLDRSNDAAIFAHCPATAEHEARKIGHLIANRYNTAVMTSTTKLGDTTTTVAYHFEGDNVPIRIKVVDNPLKAKL